jgi:predicted ribosomally synthesized peptide with SipW-like signal peptide
MSDSIKNILFSVVAIAAVSLLAIGVTAAVWNATATSENNTFAAGELSVEIGNETLGGTGTNVNAFFDVDGMFPGDKESAYVEIANTSAVDIEFEADLVSASSTSTPGLDNYLELQITQIFDLDGYSLQTGTLWSPGDWTEDRVWTAFSDGNTIRDWRTGDLVDNEGSIEFANRNQALPASETALYYIEVRLAEDTPNAQQGNTFTADLEVTAQRFED